MSNQPAPSNPTNSLNQRLDVNFALQASGLGVWELDPTTHQVLWDDRCRELFGLAKDNYLPYEQAIRCIHPEDQTRVNTAVQWAMNPQSGGSYDQTYRTLGADDGKLRWVRFHGQGYFNEMGEVYRFAGVAQDVTRQVLTQQQIEDAQNHLLRQFEQAPVGIATLSGADLTFGMINQFGAQLIGRSPDELMGKPLLEALPELTGQGLDERLRQVIATGVPHRAPEVAVSRIRQDQPETIYLDVTYQPHQQPGGDASAVMVITMDVTDQVHARRGVEESKAQLALFSNTVPAIIFYLDRQQRYQFYNETFQHWFGAEGTEAIGKTVREFQGDEVYQTIEPHLTIAYRGQTERFELTGMSRMAGERWLAIEYTPHLDPAGAVIGVIALATDITPLKHTELALQASEAQFRHLIAEAPVATGLYIGRELIIKLANQTLLGFWGKDDSVLGKPFREAVPELEGQGFFELLDQVFLTGKPYQVLAAPAQVTIGGIWGTYYFNFSFSPLRNADDEVYAILNMAVDVTQEVLARKEVEKSEARYRLLSSHLEELVQERTEELAATNEELLATNETLALTNLELGVSNEDLTRTNQNLEQFAYVASHDLQEPLRKIQSFSHLLQKRFGRVLGEPGLALLQRMQHAGERMSALIKDLLIYSRISTRQQTFGLVSLNAILAGVLDTLELAIQQRQAQIEVPELGQVPGDESQLSQLFENLLSNALKFTPMGQIPQIQIRIARCGRSELPAQVQPTSPAEQFYQISVRDQGIGFDTKYRDRIFEVFQRLHNQDTFPGTGVGLAICQRVIENHGGGLTADSRPGEGATFWVYLPV